MTTNQNNDDAIYFSVMIGDENKVNDFLTKEKNTKSKPGHEEVYGRVKCFMTLKTIVLVGVRISLVCSQCL